MKDKRNRHGKVGKSSSEQHFHKSAAISYLYCVKFLEPRSYGMQAGWQADEIQVNFKIFKIVCKLKCTESF